MLKERFIVSVIAALAFCSAAQFSLSATRPYYDSILPEDARKYALQASFLASANATEKAQNRVLDNRVQSLTKNIIHIERERDSALEKLKHSDTKSNVLEQRVRELSMTLARVQMELVDLLAALDVAYAIDLSGLKQTANDLVSTPEGRELLRLSAEGDWQGILSNERDFLKNQTINSKRAIASLGLEQLARGKATSDEIKRRFKELIELGSTNYWDWLKLGGLQLIALEPRLAEASLEKALLLATDSNIKIAILHLRSTANLMLKEYGKAVEMADSALNLSKEVSARQRGHTPARLAVIQSMLTKAIALSAGGDSVTSFELRRDAYKELSTVLESEPENASAQLANANQSLSLAVFFNRSRRYNEAEVFANEARRAVVALEKAYTTTVSLDMIRGAAQQMRGEARFQRGDLVGAKTDYLLARTVFAKLYESDSLSGVLAQGYMETLGRLIEISKRQYEGVELRIYQSELDRIKTKYAQLTSQFWADN